MLQKLRDFINQLNKLGIPLPMIRDPKTGASSVSLTLMVGSYLICFFGLLGKISKFLGDVDMSQALTLLGITSSLYFGRNLNTKSGDSTVVEKKEE